MLGGYFFIVTSDFDSLDIDYIVVTPALEQFSFTEFNQVIVGHYAADSVHGFVLCDCDRNVAECLNGIQFVMLGFTTHFKKQVSACHFCYFETRSKLICEGS